MFWDPHKLSFLRVNRQGSRCWGAWVLGMAYGYSWLDQGDLCYINHCSRWRMIQGLDLYRWYMYDIWQSNMAMNMAMIKSIIFLNQEMYLCWIFQPVECVHVHFVYRFVAALSKLHLQLGVTPSSIFRKVDLNKDPVWSHWMPLDWSSQYAREMENSCKFQLNSTKYFIIANSIYYYLL